MKVKKRPHSILLLAFIVLILPITTFADVPVVDENSVMVTDVTTVSFSVIWSVNEPATADLVVYEDIDGTTVVSDAVITPHPTNSNSIEIKEAAEENGVMKVMVSGLEPGTDYYFMTVTTSFTDDVTNFPIASPFRAVKTETKTVRTYESGGDVLPFSNDIIIEDCYMDDGITPAEGTLLIAIIEGANYPVTAFVGDGVDPPNALIDMNNVFSRVSNQNLDLSQGENLTLLNFRGSYGNSVVTYNVPVDESLSEVKNATEGLLPGWNFVSFPIEPGGSNSIDDVLAPIIDEEHELLLSAWSWDNGWKKYNPNLPVEHGLNTLKEINSTKGYWLEMGSDSSIVIDGYFNNNPIPLSENWNAISYRSMKMENIDEAVANLVSKDLLLSVWAWDDGVWKKYNPSLPLGHPLNTLKYLMPGVGYWFEMAEECSGDDCSW